MAQIRLRKDFYGTKIGKVSSQSIRVTVGFDYSGPAQTLDIEANTGKKGIWGDYDQESPSHYYTKPVSQSDTLRHYTFAVTIPLNFWGTRQLDDCAVEVVITGEGIHKDAVLWDAYTINLVAVGITFRVRGWGFPSVFPNTVKWSCYYWNPGTGGYVSDGKWHNLTDYIEFANVETGGAFGAQCQDSSGNVSEYFYSGYFSAIDGGIYQYDLHTGLVSKIG